MDQPTDELAMNLRREKANTALMATRLSLQRGQVDQAFLHCREVLLIEDDLAEAHELMGDILRLQNKDQLSLEEYRKALEFNPALTSVEEKIGLLSIEQGGLQMFDLRRQQLVARPAALKLEEKKPGLAGILSAILPGAGQWYNEDLPRGAVLLLVVILSAVFFLLPVAGVLRDLQNANPQGNLSGVALISAIAEQLEKTTALYLVWILFNGTLCTAAWIYSIVQAGLASARKNSNLRKELGIE